MRATLQVTALTVTGRPAYSQVQTARDGSPASAPWTEFCNASVKPQHLFMDPFTARPLPLSPATAPPGEPEGTGDQLEREPNQRPHDLDLHQSIDYKDEGIKGEEEEQQRRAKEPNSSPGSHGRSAS